MKKATEEKEKNFVDLCPDCGREVDLSEAEIDYPDVMLICECGSDLADTYYDTIIESLVVLAEDLGEDR